MNTGTILLQPAPTRRLRTEGARRGAPAHGPAARQAAYAPAYGRGQALRACPYSGGYAAGPAFAPRAARRRRRQKRRRSAARRLLALLLLALGLGGFYALRTAAPGLALWPDAPARPEAIPEGRPLELLEQRPLLPNGCEAASTAMLLGWAGAPAEMDELFFEYFPRTGFSYMGNDRFGPDPETAYAGDASSERGGWYCFEGPAAEGANAFLTGQGCTRRARALHGLDQETLERYLDAGVPLAVWVTRGYEEPRAASFGWVLPDGSRYTPYDNLHCVVLAGRQEEGLYRIADPLEGWQAVEPERFWQSFAAMGGRAVVIE